MKSAAMASINHLRQALEQIAESENVNLGHGNYEERPRYTAEQAQAIARRALTYREPEPVDSTINPIIEERKAIARLRRHPRFVGRFRAKHWPIYKQAIINWIEAHPPRQNLLGAQAWFSTNVPFCLSNNSPQPFYNLFVSVELMIQNGVITRDEVADMKKQMARKFILEFLLPLLRSR